MYSFTDVDIKICFSENVYFKRSMRFLGSLHERNNMQGSILIENISFSRNCDNSTTTCHRQFYFRKVCFGKIATRLK